MPRWLWEWLRGLVLILAGVLVAALVFGTPHVGWNYECAVPARYGKSGCDHYNWCEYYGLLGRKDLYGDACGGLIKFL